MPSLARCNKHGVNIRPCEELSKIGVCLAGLVSVALVDGAPGAVQTLLVGVANRDNLHIVTTGHAAFLGPRPPDDVLHPLSTDTDVRQYNSVARRELSSTAKRGRR